VEQLSGASPTVDNKSARRGHPVPKWRDITGHHEISPNAARIDGNRIVVTAGRYWPPGSNPESMYAELAQFVRQHGCSAITCDAYGADLAVTVLRRYGVHHMQSETHRSELYLELLPRVLSQTVGFPSDPYLLRELRRLERRRGFGGKDRVDHRHAAGAHDDRANACAGAVWLAARASRRRCGTAAIRWG
jgi:hypothetical protein